MIINLINVELKLKTETIPALLSKLLCQIKKERFLLKARRYDIRGREEGYLKMQRSKVSAKLNFQVAFYFILFPHVAEAAFHVD